MTSWLQIAVLRLLVLLAALEIEDGSRPRCHRALHCAYGPGGAGELLQLPHVLPLFFGGHFVVDGRVCPFFFFGFLFGLLDGVGLARFGGGDEGVDC